ncbi:MAG: FxsA family protein [Alphaproteobacteria bacterium]
MIFLLLAIFFAVPLIEVALFISVGGAIGVVPTILLCIASAVLGAIIVRHQGLQTLGRLQERLRQGELPTTELAEGAAILAAGLLLITPGFFTDTVGFVLLIPPARRRIIDWLGRHFSSEAQRFYARSRNSPYAENRQGPVVIDLVAEEVDDDSPPQPNPNSPWRRG